MRVLRSYVNCEVFASGANAANMMAALISACVLVTATLTAAIEQPLNVIGDGPVALNIPAGKGMRYAGPIVYSNEKPPIIYFPPPPKNAKPGISGLFGKKGKSIKYVPMPHHDLPVLIYTSDKVPPIHVVHPPPGEMAAYSPPSYSHLTEGFRPIPGSLSSTYKTFSSEANSPHVVTSTMEIPSTSYGTPMKVYESSFGDFDLSSSGSSKSEITASPPTQLKPLKAFSFGHPTHHISHGPPRPTYRGLLPPPRKAPPHILYSGHTPVHVYDEPDVFVHAPREVPLKTFDELPPKASFGPAKSAFGTHSVNSFSGSTISSHHRPGISQAFGSPAPYRTIVSYVPPTDNLIPSASSQFSSIASPPNSVSLTKAESTATQQQHHHHHHHAHVSSPLFRGAGSRPVQSFAGGPPTYSFSPSATKFSFGPVSIEYGPPSEPLISYSEPVGSLQSFYGAMNEGSSAKSPTPSDDGWIPGPPPKDLLEQTKEPVEFTGASHMQLPSSSHSSHSSHGPSAPGPIHSSIFRPHAKPHGPSPMHLPHFGGNKLANLLSNFKLKRSKPKFVLAPKSMHKPPIIIYYGKKPPVHVYQKPDEESNFETVISSSSVSSFPSSLSSSGSGPVESLVSDFILHDNKNNNEIIRATSIENNVDLTYGAASQKNEVRVAAPSPSQTTPKAQQSTSAASTQQQQGAGAKPAIIAAKPVEIFPQPNLQPSIYMARNSLNTIFVSDLSGSGGTSIKTYVVRSDDEEQGRSSQAVEQSSSSSLNTPEHQMEEGNLGSIISTIAQDRISGELEADDLISPSSAQEAESLQVEQEEQRDISNSNNNNNEDELEASSSNDIPPTILVVSPEQKEEIIEQQQKQQQQQPQEQQENDEQAVGETQNVPVQVIQSPSSFQSSLSNSEKEAAERSNS